MRKGIMKKTALLCLLLMLIPACAFASEPGEGQQPPGHDTQTSATVIYPYVEFGSYPQTEIVSKAEDSGVYGKAWDTGNDYIIDAVLYASLTDLEDDDWNEDGDTELDGVKYRRIRQSDALNVETDSINYYSWAESATYHYFKYEPIKWRVLEQNGNDYFLLADTAIDVSQYNYSNAGDFPWEICTVRSWLNGYDDSANAGGIDYTGDNFINAAFSADERSKIQTTYLVNSDNIANGTEGGNDTQDKIFFLSEDEIYGSNALVYGFEENYQTDDIARMSMSSAYAKAMGAYTGCAEDELGGCYWWLRSPGAHPGLAAFVNGSGRVERGGEHDTSKRRGVRPAMHVTLDSDDIIPAVSFENELYVINGTDEDITVILASFTSEGRFCNVQMQTVDNTGRMTFTMDNTKNQIDSISALAVTDSEEAKPLAALKTLGG